MKHIVVNTRLLLPGTTEGVARFATEVLQRIVSNHPEVKFTFLFDRPYADEYLYGPNVEPIVVGPPARHPVLWKMWFHWTAKRIVERLKPDLYFSPEFYISPDISVPVVSTFHDIAYEHFPGDLANSWHRQYLLKWSPIYAEKSDHILTVSEFSKDDMVKTYGTPADKISVVYNGASGQFHPISEEKKQAIRDRYTDGKPYFLFVGTIQPRKNLPNLFEAFAKYKDQTGAPDKLMIVGKKGWNYDPIFAAHKANAYADDIIFPGPKYGPDLNDVYGASKALSYTPRFEGYGLPILEAMFSETPIICSKVTCMPEVYGDAAIEVDPYNVEEITQSLLTIHTQPEVAADLIEKGRKQREKFSWEQTANGVWKALEAYL
ncbi:glycosyltransferase family 1 protein [Pontibacter sp. G13]|uniref:glycosyltransferase family 4 protein n=1 Tax=Pontibacter sp. G13 TaxID=3074898 RepID=UPI0028897B5F|nr:glycosyltransferase family 1 protein [Pontibacter sp. G13]WNJ17212.1 glycosyltransferase family 1 protein [Pontibacter sp. G13]